MEGLVIIVSVVVVHVVVVGVVVEPNRTTGPNLITIELSPLAER